MFILLAIRRLSPSGITFVVLHENSVSKAMRQIIKGKGVVFSIVILYNRYKIK